MLGRHRAEPVRLLLDGGYDLRVLVADVRVDQLTGEVQVAVAVVIPYVGALGAGDDHGLEERLSRPRMENVSPILGVDASAFLCGGDGLGHRVPRLSDGVSGRGRTLGSTSSKQNQTIGQRSALVSLGHGLKHEGAEVDEDSVLWSRDAVRPAMANCLYRERGLHDLLRAVDEAFNPAGPKATTWVDDLGTLLVASLVVTGSALKARTSSGWRAGRLDLDRRGGHFLDTR